MRSKIKLRDVFLPTFYEYFLILLPIAIYVGLEASHKGIYYFFISPEWSIANIFLCLQACSLYFRHLGSDSKRKINFDFLGILMILLVLITITSTINAYISLEEVDNTWIAIAVRIFLLILSSVGFFILVPASKSINNE